MTNLERQGQTWLDIARQGQTWGQSGRTITMHLRGKIEVLALGVFLYISLIFYVCHVTPLIIGNLNFLERNYLTTFSKISMSHHRVLKK